MLVKGLLLPRKYTAQVSDTTKMLRSTTADYIKQMP